jgi:hypothetical protein
MSTIPIRVRPLNILQQTIEPLAFSEHSCNGPLARARQIVVSLSPRLPFKLEDPDSTLGPASTQGFKIIEEKELHIH